MAFVFRPAVREQTPLLIGVVGPSGAGKTFSLLRLATGIQKVRGGKIAVTDTEARRALHYAGRFQFIHCDFKPPFSSDRYREMLVDAAKAAEGGVVMVDSMSHEHEGEGGYLEFHEAELDRIAGDDFKKRERSTFTAWIKPAAARRRLINALLQTNCAFVFGFRAKEKLLIRPGQQPVNRGWQAICGDEFAYEMTCRALLPPGAAGVPDWSAEAFSHGVPKLLDDHRAFFQPGQPLSEDIGEKLARWAAGGQPVQPANQQAAKPTADQAARGMKMLAAFQQMNVGPDEVEKALGKPVAEWTDADFDRARALYAKWRKEASSQAGSPT